jgi:secondary thiamine-phosphate synthase enzyme
VPNVELTLCTSAKQEIIDVTAEVCEAVREAGVASGIACISVPHCTAAVYVNENERGLVQDVMRAIEEIAVRDGYLHDRIDNNASAHVAASIIGPSVTLPVIGGKLRLGTWQRVMLVELDGPRSRRTINVTIVAG